MYSRSKEVKSVINQHTIVKANILTNNDKLSRGFTLIELLVVVSIIGMLASVVLVSLQGARNKAKDAKIILEIRELTKAMELYRLDNNGYPADGWWHATALACPIAAQNGNHLISEANMFDANFTSKYISKIPTELVTCGIHYLGMRTTDFETTPLTCDDGTNTINPDGGPTGDRYHYVFVVDLINTYSPSPSLPKTTTWGGNRYCILGPKR